jgi:hypothetical protein
MTLGHQKGHFWVFLINSWDFHISVDNKGHIFACLWLDKIRLLNVRFGWLVGFRDYFKDPTTPKRLKKILVLWLWFSEPRLRNSGLLPCFNYIFNEIDFWKISTKLKLYCNKIAYFHSCNVLEINSMCENKRYLPSCHVVANSLKSVAWRRTSPKTTDVSRGIHENCVRNNVNLKYLTIYSR